MYLLEQLLLAIYFHFLAIYIHTNVDLSPLQSRYMWILTSLIGKHLKVREDNVIHRVDSL